MKHVRGQKTQLNLDCPSAKSQLPLIFNLAWTATGEGKSAFPKHSRFAPALGHLTNTSREKTLSTHSIIRSDTYHIWVKRGCNLLINEIIPVNWGEEDVILNLHLLQRERSINSDPAKVSCMA